MKAALQIRQSQQLALTPQLRQAIRLLQMSTLDLQHEIDQALAHNPLLERMDDPWERSLSLGPDGSLRPPGRGTADTDRQAEPPAAHGEGEPLGHHATSADDLGAAGHEAPVETYPADELEGADSALWGLESAGTSTRRNDFDDGDRSPGNTLVQDLSLHEHLMAQLREAGCSPRQRELVHMLIDATEDDGYLRTPLDELLAACPPEEGLGIGELEDALRVLQGFDPSGVAARSLNECLSLQLTARDEEAPLPPEALALARAIIDQDCLSMLASPRDQERLAKRLHCRDSALHQAIDLIRSLDPKPGNRFSAEPPRYVTPDVLVHKTSQGWRAVLNRDVIPQLCVNREYERQLKNLNPGPRAPGGRRAMSPPSDTPATAGTATPLPADDAWREDAWRLDLVDIPEAAGSLSDDDDGEPADQAAETRATSAGAAGATVDTRGVPAAEDSLSRQLQEARLMVRQVEQRSDTILRVAQAIVDRQQAFFTHGPVAMRPLVLREIAEAVGLHESTISRVTTQKYMATPFGNVVELKYFFGSHVATDTGGAASSTAICAQIQQLIKEEDSTQPLSDNQITELLGQQGIKVARRTVAKYRESLRILPAAQRKTR